MSSIRVTTNFRDNFGTDLGNKLITKDYLMSVYPNIAQEIGKTPELWTWGYGGSGHLGNAQINSISTPITTFAGGSNWKQISCGDVNTVAIKTDGTLWTWGKATYGQLGNGATSGNISTPVTTFAGGTNWKQVSIMSTNIAAIKTDGTLWTWGRNNNSSLGINGSNIRSTPVTTFAGGTNWKQVDVGRNFYMLAIKTDGTLWSWGNNFNGVLGTNNTLSVSTPVTTFAGGTNWKQVSCGYGTLVGAIKTDGTLWTWGYAANGRLGNTIASFTSSCTPVTTFAGGTNWKQIAVGDKTMFAVKTDGTLWCWGENLNGELGINVTGTRSTPVTTFAGGTNWKQVSVSRDSFGAIKTDGTLWVGGNSFFGTLGVNNTSTRLTPVTTFAGGSNWKQISAGPLHMAAIESADFI